MSQRIDICDMTSEELDELPNYYSGLPTNQAVRAEALQAWREGGPKGLNRWRCEREQRLRNSRRSSGNQSPVNPENSPSVN